MMAGESSSFRRNAVEVFATRVGVVLILVATNVLVTRKLTTADRGVYALIVALPLTLQVIAGLGVNQANVYLVNQGVRVRSLVVDSLYLCFMIGAALLLVMTIFRDALLDSVLDGVPTAAFIVVVALMPFSLMDLFFNGVIQGLRLFRIFNTRRILVSCLMLGLVALLVVVLDLGLAGAVVALAVTMVVTGLWFLAIVVRIDGLQPGADWTLVGRMVRYGSKSYLANLEGFLTYRLALYLVAFLMDSEAVAYYAVATSLVEMVWFIPDSVGTVLFPRLSALRDDAETHRVTAGVCRQTLLLTVAAALAVAALGRLAIVVLFGERYLPSLTPLLILLPGVTAISVYKVLWRNFSGRDRQQVTVVAAGVALALNAGLSFALIPRLGLAGAALSSSLSYFGGTAVLLLVFLRESQVGWRATLVPTRADLAGQLAWLLRRGSGRRPQGGDGPP